jgi:acyl transferase domain-containing protein
MAQDRIAVIGMAGRFPGALDTRELWSNLAQGVVSCRHYTNEELLRHGVAPRWLDDPGYIKMGYPIDHVDMFDAEFFRMSPREAAITDPQQRLFLECVWVALETAGYDPSCYPGDIGLYAGSKMNSYLLNNLREPDPDAPQRFDRYELLLGNDKDYLTTRVSYKLNLKGPSVVIQTACSSSLVAVHQACEALISGDCDMAVAGGVSVRVPAHAGYYFQNGAILSPDGYCRAYSDDASGTVEGNGVGVVVLKRLEDAVASADNILAVIRGSAVNNDGGEKIGFTAPSGDGQMKVVSEAMQVAGVSPEEITLVEGHGTGTPLGDPVEVTALTNVYRKYTDRTAFCALGSVKANIGHLDTAAGIASFIKTVLALQHKTIAPAANYSRPNPKIGLDQSPFYIPRNAQPWNCTGPRIAGVTSLGIGGTNCHVIVEEAPPPAAAAATNCEWHVLTLSARSPAALDRMARNLAAHLEQNEHLALADVAWTLLEGRKQFPYRRAVLCRDRSEALRGLLEADGELGIRGEAADPAPQSFDLEIAPLTGRSMKRLATCFDRLPTLRNQLSVCVDPANGGWSAAEALGRVAAAGQIDDAYVESMEGQLLQLSMLHGLARWLMSAGLRPQTLIGEAVVCACVSGSMPFEEAVRRIRAQEASITPAGTHPPRTPVSQPRVVLGGDALCGLLRTAGNVARPSRQEPGNEDSAAELQLLRMLAELWTGGLGLSGGALYSGEKRRRLSLPSYPFDYQSYWIEPARTAPERPGRQDEVVTQPLQEKLPIAKENHQVQYYVPSWTTKPLFKIDLERHFAGKHVLLIQDELGQGQQWIGRMLESGSGPVSQIGRGGGFQRIGDREYTVDPANPQDYERCLDALSAAGAVPRYILYCSRSMQGNADSAAAQDLTELWELTALVQGIGRSHKLQDLTLAILTQETQDILNTEVPKPGQAILECFVKSVPREYPQITVKLLDIDALARDKGNERVLDRVLEDMTAPGSNVLAYRNGMRWQKDLQAVSLPPSEDRVGNGEARGKRGVYLLTGGLGDIAMELSAWLAGRGASHLVLLAKNDGAATPADLERAGSRTHFQDLRGIEQRFQREAIGKATPEHEEFSDALERLCVAHIVDLIRSHRELEPGREYDSEEIVDAITAQARFKKYVQSLIRVLIRAGFMRHRAGKLTVTEQFAACEPAEIHRRRVIDTYPRFTGMVDLLSHCVAHYAAVFSGDMEPTTVLYPDGTGKLLERAYQNTAPHGSHERYGRLLLEYIGVYRKERPGAAIRVLEIGGGNGNLTKTLLPALHGSDVHYCFTDISRSFVRDAESLAKSHGFNGVTFATLDISKDIEAQGFARSSFDIVVGLDVVHATPDIEHTLRNVWSVVKDGGALGLVETTRDSTWLTMVMGLTAGWWAFQDDRDMSPLLEPVAWTRKLEQAKLGPFALFPEPAPEPRADCSLILIEKRPEQHGGANDRLAAILPETVRYARDDERKEAERREKLQRLQALGTEVVLVRADVADRQELAAALRDLGPLRHQIDGIIHTAGVADGKLIQGRTREDIEDILAPKVLGVQNLYHEFKDRPLSMWVNCSSVVAVNGAVGQFAHCAANQYLDDFTAYLRRNGQPNAVSINWEAWSEIGQAEESRKRFRAQMTDRFITGRGRRAGLLTWSELGDGRYTVYETTFSQARDWFLLGHRVQGKSVLPGTVFVEMAVEAAKATYGNKAIELSEVKFFAPLFVEQDERVKVLTILSRQDQHYDVTLVSVRGDVEQAQLHVTGRARVSPVPGTVTLDVADLETRCAGTALDERIEDNDARWNCLSRATLNKNMGLAEVTLPDEYRSEASRYTLHPAVLDVAIGFLPLQFRQTSAYVPVHYKKIVVFEPLPDRLFSFARIRGAVTRQSDSLDINVTLLDPSGKRLVDIDNLTLRRVHAAMDVRPALNREAPELLQFLQHVKRHTSNWLTPAEGVEAFGRILASGLPRVVTTKSTPSAAGKPLAHEESRASPRRTGTSAAANVTEDLMKARPALRSEYISPSNRIERILSEIWSSVLGVGDVGIEDNFFELGGDSMLSIQVSSLVNNKMGVEVPTGLLFEYPTIRKFSEFLRNRLGESDGDMAAPPALAADATNGTHALSAVASGRLNESYGHQMAVIDSLVSNIQRKLGEE